MKPSPAPSSDWESLVGSLTPLDRAAWLPVLLADQRRRWALGEHVLAEEYRDRVPGVGEDPELFLDLVYGEMLLRHEQGQTPRLEELLDRFPDRAESLRRQYLLFELVGGRSELRTPEQEALPCGIRADASVRTDHETYPANGQGGGGDWPLVSGYEILGLLGHGGMGVVYKARHLRLNRLVALKMIRAGGRFPAEERDRFGREAELIARLRHEHVIGVYEVGEDERRPYIALEYCPGKSLDRRLSSEPLPPRVAAGLVEKVARGVHAAHTASVVHRDLKPANVLLLEGPDTPLENCTPRVSDFGLAKRSDEQGQTRTGAVLGTPAYMSPEQARGETGAVGPRSDVWALGVILYECLTGRVPFQGASALETIEQICQQDPRSPRALQPLVHRDLETVCLKCLQKDAAHRYASAADVAGELRCWLEDLPIRARPPGLAGRAWRWCRRRPTRAAR